MKIINAFLMKEFSIILDSNPTTGYSWVPLLDKQFLELKRRYFKTNSKRMGTIGTEIFIFNPIRSGITTLTMSYKRAWENDIIQKADFEIRIS